MNMKHFIQFFRYKKGYLYLIYRKKFCDTFLLKKIHMFSLIYNSGKCVGYFFKGICLIFRRISLCVCVSLCMYVCICMYACIFDKDNERRLKLLLTALYVCIN